MTIDGESCSVIHTEYGIVTFTPIVPGWYWSHSNSNELAS